MTKEETNKQSGIFLMEYDMIPTLASKTEVPTPHPCHNRSILIRIQLMIRWRLPNTIILTLVRFDVWTLSWIITLEVFQKKNAPCFGKMLVKIPPVSRALRVPTFQPNGTEKPTERLHRRHRDGGGHSAGLGGALRGLLQSSAGVLVGFHNISCKMGFPPNYYFRG